MKTVTLKFENKTDFTRFINSAPALFINITPLFLKVTCECSEALIEKVQKEYGAIVIQQKSPKSF